MKDEERMVELITRLEQKFKIVDLSRISDPFQVLVATILSQNTSDSNSSRAFSRLKERFDLRPEVLAILKPKDIKPSIRIAGLSNIRSHRIIEVSKEILTRFDGDLSKIFILPLNQARKTLMSINGVGPKTADVLLSFVGKYPVMPVDTNIFRVVDRMGFTKGRRYERTRRILEKLIPSEKLLDMHFYLIRFGREICKPRKPLCTICPVYTLCDYALHYVNRKERK